MNESWRTYRNSLHTMCYRLWPLISTSFFPSYLPSSYVVLDSKRILQINTSPLAEMFAIVHYFYSKVRNDSGILIKSSAEVEVDSIWGTFSYEDYIMLVSQFKENFFSFLSLPFFNFQGQCLITAIVSKFILSFFMASE